MENYELNYELHESEREQKKYSQDLEHVRNKYAIMLKGEMGDDIDNVLSGKTKITLPLKDRIIFKIKCFFNNLFNAL